MKNSTGRSIKVTTTKTGGGTLSIQFKNKEDLIQLSHLITQEE